MEGARADLEAGLAIYRSDMDRLGEANVLKVLGDVERRVDALDVARGHYDSALVLYREIRVRTQ
ncbi:hypothetical protein NOLU111490_18285 [Novosphingobium lubricantis]